jgi:hypothetical protein
MGTQCNLEDVADFIASRATEEDCQAVFALARNRLRALQEIQAIGVRAGVRVELDGLTPKYLNGICGTVRVVRGRRCDLDLDEPSIKRLASTRHSYVASTGGVLMGIPVVACKAMPPSARA